MPIIDQRILIVAPSEAVWPYLSETALYSRWNKGAKQISLLSTKLKGVGVRRRCTDSRGKSVVEEMTAWLDNIGYEYIVIEGPYKSFIGRLRLQPLPEGTLITWEIDYKLRGAFAGLRDALGFRRRLRKQTTDSLRILKRTVEASGIRLDPERQKRVAMQADPGLQARQARMNEPTTRAPMQTPTMPQQPIYSPPRVVVGEDDLTEIPSTLPPAPATSVPTAIPAPPTAAPQITLPPAAVRAEIPPPPVVGERTIPAAAKPAIPEPPIKVDDTKPSIKQVAEPTIASSAADDNADSLASTVPIELVAPKPPAPPPTATQNVIVPPPSLPDLRPPLEPSIPMPTPAPSELPQPPQKMETGEMSIWDVFGVSRPSDVHKKDVQDIIASLKPKLPDPEPIQMPTSLSAIFRNEPAEPTVQSKALSASEPEPMSIREEPPTPVNLKSQPPRPVSRQHALWGVKPDEEEKESPVLPRLSQLRSGVKVRSSRAPIQAKADVKVRCK